MGRDTSSGLVSAAVTPIPARAFTMNIDSVDGFECLACGHWVVYTDETEWGDLYVCKPKRFGHIHGTEPFRFCPSCGAMVLTPEQWVDTYPEDAGKTFGEIYKRHLQRNGCCDILLSTVRQGE